MSAHSFVKNKFEGQGVFTWTSGEVLVATWRDNKPVSQCMCVCVCVCVCVRVCACVCERYILCIDCTTERCLYADTASVSKSSNAAILVSCVVTFAHSKALTLCCISYCHLDRAVSLQQRSRTQVQWTGSQRRKQTTRRQDSNSHRKSS